MSLSNKTLEDRWSPCIGSHAIWCVCIQKFPCPESALPPKPYRGNCESGETMATVCFLAKIMCYLLSANAQANPIHTLALH